MQASPAEHQVYVWHPPGARQAVELRAEVVERITEVARAGLETEGRGIEAGGLLIGRTRRERGRTVVEIVEAEPVECEHAAGPSWMLSNADRRAMDAKIRAHKGAVVGCYRSNTRREFASTIEDLGLLDSHFPMMLLVDARRGAPLRAAFVFRGDRDPQPAFPFTPEALEVVTAAAPRRARAVAPDGPRKPIRIHVPKSAVAAAAVVLGVAGGVWYDGARRAPRPVEAKKAEVAAKPEAEKRVAETPTPPVELPAPVEAVPPAAVADVPVLPPPPVASADRAALPPAPSRPVRREFVPPNVERTAPAPSEVVDLPTVEAPRSAAPSIVAGGQAPRPVIATAAAAPAVDSRVAVAVDAVPVHGGKFVPPETIQPATPRGFRVDRAVVINVRVYLDRSGKVDFAELLSDGTGANRDLASAAVFSARKWRFSPAKVDGRAVPAQAVLRFRFLPETRP